MGVRNALESLRFRWWLPVIGGVLGVLMALAVTASTPSRYSSTTRLFVGSTGSKDVAAVYAGGLFTEQRVASYVDLIQGDRMSGEVISRVGLTTTPGELASRVTARVLPNTVLVEISVTDSSAGGARTLADAYGKQFTADVVALETAPNRDTATVKVSAVEPAAVDETLISPVPYRNDALGALLGLLAGAAVAMAVPGMGHRLRTPLAVGTLTDAPVLCAVTDRKRETDPGGVISMDLRSTSGRTMQSAALVLRGAGARTVVVSSPVGGEGRSTVALNLAKALSGSGCRVLLLDADPGGRGVSRALGLVERPGLTEVLAGTADPQTVMWSATNGGPSVIGRGTAAAGRATGPVGSSRLEDLVTSLRAEFDLVIIDVPPVLSCPDVVDLARAADGLVLVCRFGGTRRADLASAVAALEGQGVNVLSVVLNRVPEAVAVQRGWCQRYEADPTRRSTSGPPAGDGAVRGWPSVDRQICSGGSAKPAVRTGVSGSTVIDEMPERPVPTAVLGCQTLPTQAVPSLPVRASSPTVTVPAPSSLTTGGRLMTVIQAARTAGYVDLLLAQVVPLGVSFQLTLISATLLGPERRGMLTFLTTAALLFGALAFGSLHVPVVSGLRDGDSANLRYGVLVVVWLWGAMSLAGLTIVVGGWIVDGSWTLRTSTEVGWGLIGGGLVIAQLLASRVLQGLGHNREYQIVTVSQSLVYLVATGVVLILTRSPLLMFAAWYCSVAVGVLLAVARLRGRLPAPSGAAPSRRAFRAFLRTATANNVGSIGQMVMLRADVLVVAALVGPAAAGVYGIALSLSELALIAPEVFSLSVYANRARMTAECWSVHLRQALRLSAGVTLLAISVIALTAVLLAAGPLSTYQHLVPLVLIILPGTLCAGYSRIALGALQALNVPSAVWRFGVLALVVAIAYVPAAIIAGSYGTAVMSTTAYALTAVYLWHSLRSRQATR